MNPTKEILLIIARSVVAERYLSVEANDFVLEARFLVVEDLNEVEDACRYEEVSRCAELNCNTSAFKIAIESISAFGTEVVMFSSFIKNLFGIRRGI